MLLCTYIDMDKNVITLFNCLYWIKFSNWLTFLFIFNWMKINILFICVF